jgi:hypothetical protein
MKGLVESLETLLREPLAEVVRSQLRLDVESGNERGQLPGARQRLVPDLDLERLREDQAEEDDRDQAHQCELSQQAEPRQANGDLGRRHATLLSRFGRVSASSPGA